MSKKKNSARYDIRACDTRPHIFLKRGMTAQQYVAKETSEKYRRLKK